MNTQQLNSLRQKTDLCGMITTTSELPKRQQALSPNPELITKGQVPLIKENHPTTKSWTPRQPNISDHTIICHI